MQGSHRLCNLVRGVPRVCLCLCVRDPRATLPPCLFGSAEEGLPAEVYLTWDTNLTSIKRNNNTYSHYGEMAMWQNRGYQAYAPEK